MSTPTLPVPSPSAPSRRDFLKAATASAGVFVLGVHVPLLRRAGRASAAAAVDPNVFLKIGADNVVTIVSKHFEMGQGVTTGLATLIAEELEADWAQIQFEFAPNDVSLYNNLAFGPVMGTGGSTSMVNSWEQMRRVGATARMMFVSAAAARWTVPPGEIRVDKGVVRHARSGRQATLGELAAEAMRMPVPVDVPLKPAADWKLIGSRLPRLDSVGKTTGTALFALDVREPNTLTAVVKRPELFGATLASVDDSAARRIPGVVDVVPISTGVAVLASDTWSAIRGRDALRVTWDTQKAERRSTPEILEDYRELAAGPGLTALTRGDAARAVAGAVRTLEADFTFAYLAHAPMEPLNCVIAVRGGGAEIWSGCQLQTVDENVAAHVLGVPADRITIHTLLGGGSFGRRGDPVGAWTRELAEVGKAVGERAPVHLVWTREDDIKGGSYRPLTLHRVRVGVDDRGHIAGWRHRIVSQSIFSGTPFEQMAVHDGVDHSTVEGVVDTLYAIPDFAVEVSNAQSPVPVLWWRSVGHGHSAYVMESVIDELAGMAGKDPVAFRLELLADQPRAAAVVRMAAERGGWGADLGQGRGRGLAYHFSFNTHVAMVADVTVTGPSIHVDRIVAAVDCGVAINPDVVAAQIEGAIGFSLSAALRNRITLNRGVVQQTNFDDYEPTRMRDMPEVEVHLIPSTEPPTGIGEPGVPPVAPAIGNAVFAATGRRLRSLPLDLGT